MCTKLNERQFAVGLSLSEDITRRILGESRSAPVVMTTLGCLYILLIIASAFAGTLAWKQQSGISAFSLQLGIFIAIAHFMRALECLVHDGNHYAYLRQLPRWNDRLCNLSAGYPVIADASSRTEHNRDHHRFLASEERDPDLRRGFTFRWLTTERSNPWGFLRVMFCSLVGYTIQWLPNMADNIYVRALLWHGSIVGILCLVLPPGEVVRGWVLYWIVPFFLFLPSLRYLGESAEHEYRNGRSVMDNTISNIGWFHGLIHPIGDGYHTLHHICPTVPGFRLKRLHQWMLDNCPEYAKKVKHRLRLFESPRQDK